MIESLKQRIKRHEGYRPEPYRCNGGQWTIGYGHGIGRGKCKISRKVADIILNEDLLHAMMDVESLGLEIDKVRREVLIEMTFWHGFKGLLGFKKMLTALEVGDYDKAADEMMDSNSGRKYSGRMSELAYAMRHGRFEGDENTK